ncbi:iron chelate uptake ABC transporter family permease subunit [Timonella sp. A28]|uniref:iron chelate uptake ABC transporter family permease subunit n=1 Tax=Timonella sp. A28 TaxID=3442640 RepID=UPI003EB6C201
MLDTAPLKIEAPIIDGRPTGSFSSAKKRRTYWILIAVLSVLSVLFAGAILAWGNPMPYGTQGFWRIAELRATSLVVILVVVICQAVATIAFQTVTNNRIITPSILGFEALYVAVQTSAVYFMGIAGVVALQGLAQFSLQVALMVVFSLLLYGWLLTGKYANLQVMLLVGIVIGGGLRSISTFMQRLLTPSEFDVLTARLFGSVANADASYFPLAIPLCIAAAGFLYWRSRRLNVTALGRDVTSNLGINHKREVIIVLFFVSVLMAVSTSLIGPMTFFGFLTAILAYQFAGTHDHKYVFPIAVLTGFVVLAGSYFVLKNIFYAEGAVSIIIEAVGGLVFLAVILRKGRL